MSVYIGKYIGKCICCGMEDAYHTCVQCGVHLHLKCGGWVEENLKCAQCLKNEEPTPETQSDVDVPSQQVVGNSSGISSQIYKKYDWSCALCDQIYPSKKKIETHLSECHNQKPTKEMYRATEVQKLITSNGNKEQKTGKTTKPKIPKEKVMKKEKPKPSKPSSYDFRKLANLFSNPDLTEEFSLNQTTTTSEPILEATKANEPMFQLASTEKPETTTNLSVHPRPVLESINLNGIRSASVNNNGPTKQPEAFVSLNDSVSMMQPTPVLGSINDDDSLMKVQIQPGQAGDSHSQEFATLDIPNAVSSFKGIGGVTPGMNLFQDVASCDRDGSTTANTGLPLRPNSNITQQNLPNRSHAEGVSSKLSLSNLPSSSHSSLPELENLSPILGNLPPNAEESAFSFEDETLIDKLMCDDDSRSGSNLEPIVSVEKSVKRNARKVRAKFTTPYVKTPRGKCSDWENCKNCSRSDDCGICRNCLNKGLHQKCLERQCHLVNKKLKAKQPASSNLRRDPDAENIAVLNSEVSKPPGDLLVRAPLLPPINAAQGDDLSSTHIMSVPMNQFRSESSNSTSDTNLANGDTPQITRPSSLTSKNAIKQSLMANATHSPAKITPRVIFAKKTDVSNLHLIQQKTMSSILSQDINTISNSDMEHRSVEPEGLAPQDSNTERAAEVEKTKEAKPVNFKMPKIYHCKVCGKEFARYLPSVNHCKKDTTWTCEHCGIVIKQKNNVGRHKGRCPAQRKDNAILENQFEDENIYECEICQKAFKQDSSLKAHKKYHDKDKTKLLCDKCDYQASGESELKKHITNKHNDGVVFECNYCDYECFSKSGLTKHTSSVHKDSMVKLSKNITISNDVPLNTKNFVGDKQSSILESTSLYNDISSLDQQMDSSNLNSDDSVSEQNLVSQISHLETVVPGTSQETVLSFDNY